MSDGATVGAGGGDDPAADWPAADWPAWAREQVAVHAPDPQWQERGAQQVRLLGASLAAFRTAAVEHVGSTAVPGLAAKPVLDLQVAVADLGCADAVAQILLPGGWHAVPPELDGRPWRRFFVLVDGDRRVAHLHLLLGGSARWHEQLAFRDALRADPALVRRYAALKRSLAARHPDDREAYTAGKAEFLRAALGTGQVSTR